MSEVNTGREVNTEDNASNISTVQSKVPTKSSLADFSLTSMNMLSLWILMVVTGVVMLMNYHYWFADRKTSIAVVDVNAVVATQQAQFVALLSGDKVTDKDREQSFLMVSSFGERMKTAIIEIQKECHCTLLVKAAVIGEMADYTDSLKAKLGMTSVVAIPGQAQEDLLKGFRK